MVRARRAPPVLYHRGRPANALVAEIHNRVVILPEEAYATWLNPRTSLDTVRSLMEPYPGLPVLSPTPAFSISWILPSTFSSDSLTGLTNSLMAWPGLELALSALTKIQPV